MEQYGGKVEQWLKVWKIVVKKCGGTMEQCGGTIWNHMVEQWNSVTSVVEKWNSV